MMQILNRQPVGSKTVEHRDLYLYDSFTGVCMPINSGATSTQIFLAEYGKTTYQEVLDAYRAQKLIICQKGNVVGWFKQFVYDRFEFVQSSTQGDVIYSLHANDDWTSEKIGYITSPDGTKWALTVSDTGEITAVVAPVITKQPKDVTTNVGNIVTFSVEANGATELIYKWYIKRPSEEQFSIWLENNATPTFQCSSSNNGMQVYCIVIDSYGNSMTSDIATLTVLGGELVIVTQPTNQTAVAGKLTTFEVEVTAEEPSYQWFIKRYYDNDFSIWEGKTTRNPSFTPNDNTLYFQLYCVITDIYGETVTSDIVTFTLHGSLMLTDESTALTVASGTKVYFYVKPVDGSTYRWFIQRANETEFSVWANRTTASTNFACQSSNNGMQVYCEITNSNGNISTTGVATLTVT